MYGQTEGSQCLITHFLKGAQQLSHLKVLKAASWDLQMLLRSLCMPHMAHYIWQMVDPENPAGRVGELHVLSASLIWIR